jgi:hypothetical protein
VTLTANKFMPIPGAELSTEATLKILLERGGGIEYTTQNEQFVQTLVDNGILV